MIFGLSRVNVPPENPVLDSKIPYSELMQTHSDVLKLITICKTNILSNIVGTSLSDLVSVLRYQFLIPKTVCDKFVRFISVHEIDGIKWEMENGCRKPLIFLAPREKVSVAGSHSIWLPNSKLSNVIQPVGDV